MKFFMPDPALWVSREQYEREKDRADALLAELLKLKQQGFASTQPARLHPPKPEAEESALKQAQDPVIHAIYAKLKAEHPDQSPEALRREAERLSLTFQGNHAS